MVEIPPRAAAPAEAAPAAPVAARRRWWRRALRVGIWSVVALMLLAAGLAFVASRTMTLQWATQQVVRLTDGRLQIEGITGSVLTGIAADSIRWQDGPVSVAITSPRFAYHPFAMLDGLVRIESISAASVEVDLPPGTALADPQPTFRLPPAMASMLPVAIERVDLGRLIVRRAGSQLANLQNLELTFRHDGDRISARLLNLDVVAGDRRIGMHGDAAVLARAPYATDGRFAVRLPMQPRPLRLDVRINGPIEELAIRASSLVAGAALDARTVVHTLDPRPLRQVRIDLKDLDLSRYDPVLPVTSLSGSYVAEIMPVWATGRRPLLIGPLNLTNTLAAALDRKRLPVTQAKAVVGYVDGGFELQGLQASGPIGEVTGDGWVGPESVRLALASDKLNLQALDSTSAPRVLTARIVVGPVGSAAAPPAGTQHEAGPRARPLSLDATAADASLAAELKGVIVDGRQLQISRAQVQFKDGSSPQGGGRAGFLGSVGLAAPWPVDLSGELRNLDLAQLPPSPPALLNGTWRISGRIADRLQAYLSLDASRYRGLPLTGRLAATLSIGDGQLQRLSAVHGALRWGSGTIDASGALGGPADVLRLAVNLPKLGEIEDGADGAVTGQASLRGSLAAPSLEAQLEGRDFAVGGLRLARVKAIVEGARRDHRVEVDAAGSGQRLVLGAEGGIGEDGLWRGLVNHLSASHPLLQAHAAEAAGSTAAPLPQADLRSLQPFALVAGSGRAAVRNARFDLRGARLNLKQVDWRAPALTLSADASGVAMRWLGRFVSPDVLPQDAPHDLRLAAALEFSGNLDRVDAEGWRGRIRVEREAGDLVLTGPGGGDAAPAGLRTLQASLGIDQRKLDLVVNIDGEHIGRMALEARTTLQPASEPAWSAAAIVRSPLAGRLDLAASSFRWLPPLADASWRVDGALSARLQLAGTLGRPRAQGAVTGSNLSAKEQALGLQLANGVLAAELAGDRVDVKLLRFESGAGSVAVSGLLQPAADGRSQARIVIDRLPIPLGVGQRVVLSGSTTATLAEHAFEVTGRLVADDGIIEIEGGSGLDANGVAFPGGGQAAYPATGSLADAAVRAVLSRSDDGWEGSPVGASVPGAGPAPALAAGSGAAGIDTDVEVNLGRRFRVVGSGFDANLRGAIRLRGPYPVAPRASGTVEIVNGNYQVSGRQLRIKRGRIVFDGALHDPGLDIVAVRDSLKVEPGLAIGGTASSPVVRLVSTPEVPDPDKLAWLVLGGSLADTRGAGQLPALRRAAATLFGGAAAAEVAGLAGKAGAEPPSLRPRDNAAGDIGPDLVPGAVAMVGQRLAARLCATYEQSLRGVWDILKLQYEITDRLSLTAQAGSDRAAGLIRLVPAD